MKTTKRPKIGQVIDSRNALMAEFNRASEDQKAGQWGKDQWVKIRKLNDEIDRRRGWRRS